LTGCSFGAPERRAIMGDAVLCWMITGQDLIWNGEDFKDLGISRCVTWYEQKQNR